MEVPSGPGASSDDPHVIVIAPISDNDTAVGLRASDDEHNDGHRPEWTCGVKFHWGCRCRKLQSRSEAVISTWRRVFPSSRSLCNEARGRQRPLMELICWNLKTEKGQPKRR